MKKIRNPFAGMEEKGYNCFACCPSNPFGLKMEFYEDGDDIVSIWEPHLNFQSWIGTLHGGIQATLLDEVGGWIISRKLQTTGVTTHLNVRYKTSVPVGKGPLEIRGRLKEMKRNFAFIDAEISHEGKVCTTCEMIYCTVSKETAKNDFLFEGCFLEEEL
jgi:acyl-coenzyme A thioesterase PaaI-like protein